MNIQPDFKELLALLEKHQDEEPLIHVNEEALLSEAALAEDWNRPDEDEAWQHLQAVQ